MNTDSAQSEHPDPVFTIEPNLQVTGHRIGHSAANTNGAMNGNSLKTNGGPARI
jgi:hypothetical protein